VPEPALLHRTARCVAAAAVLIATHAPACPSPRSVCPGGAIEEANDVLDSARGLVPAGQPRCGGAAGCSSAADQCLGERSLLGMAVKALAQLRQGWPGPFGLGILGDIVERLRTCTYFRCALCCQCLPARYERTRVPSGGRMSSQRARWWSCSPTAWPAPRQTWQRSAPASARVHVCCSLTPAGAAADSRAGQPAARARGVPGALHEQLRSRISSARPGAGHSVVRLGWPRPHAWALSVRWGGRQSARVGLPGCCELLA
jgi:hypothetical protein